MDSTSTSRSLLARLNNNDPGAWDRLVALYAPLVWHWCRKMALPEQEIADVFQEVCKAVASHIQHFRKDRPNDTFRGWLRTITRNKVLDHFRALQREPQAAGGSSAQWRWAQLPEAEGDEETDRGDAYCLLLERALTSIQDEFEERTWRAFSRVVVDGVSPCEAAKELGMSAGAVRVAKCRVLHRLRQELGDLV
jgi:RNA polymerase sigma-70 factor (ECF subfamily)